MNFPPCRRYPMRAPPGMPVVPRTIVPQIKSGQLQICVLARNGAGIHLNLQSVDNCPFFLHVLDWGLLIEYSQRLVSLSVCPQLCDRVHHALRFL
jgi:hypothetical protein